jgi:hypothetical protein
MDERLLHDVTSSFFAIRAWEPKRVSSASMTDVDMSSMSNTHAYSACGLNIDESYFEFGYLM